MAHQPDSCPGSTHAGCRCVLHHPGLGAYSPDPIAYELALRPLRPTHLRVITSTDEIVCDGTMTCPCLACVGANNRRQAYGAGPAQFKVRPPRAAA